MAAKLLHSLTDENPDLERQIGCITGVFQLFDHRHVLSSRRVAGHSPKRFSPHGSSEYNSGNFERESNYLRHRPLERNSNKNIQDKHRTSTESSRASFSSSSRSSSFSSLDCNKIVQTDPLSFDRIFFPETPSRDSAMSQSSASPQLGRKSLDLRDVVKDSMYRELRGLSPKTTTKEATDYLVRNWDSPRPRQQSKANDGAYSMGVGPNLKQNMPADLKESVRALTKLREAPWYFDEPRELSRSMSYQLKEGSSISSSKDAPRFSNDGREVKRLSFDSRDNSKLPLKLKEQPRLSLDSRESSMRSHYSDQKSNLFPRNANRDAGNSSDEAMNHQKTSGTLSRPSVVAKLMGLDTLPDSSLGSDCKMGSGLGLITNRAPEDFDSFPRSLKTMEHHMPIRLPSPSRNTLKEPKSPRWKNLDAVVMKPISRFPIEPAPWRQVDGPRNSPNAASQKPPAKAHNSPFPSVYSEIENRLKHLEFTQSGKDLRALKQIMEAMQEKGLLETENGAQDSHFFTQKDQEPRYSNFTSNSRLSNHGKAQGSQIVSSANGGSTSSRSFDSPIVIMKPAKLVEKSATGASSVIQLDSRRVSVGSKTAKDQTTKSGHRDDTVNSTDAKTSARQVKPVKTLTRQQQLSKESASNSAKSSGSISPRLQQKKHELEKRSRPPAPPSDSIKSRKQTSKQQQAESNSPGRRRRSKYSNYQEGDHQLSGISSEVRNLSFQETYVADLQSDSERYDEAIGSPCLSTKGGSNSPMSKAKDEPLGEFSIVAQEYPSPVSVLDDLVYIDDSPSPVKHVLKTPQDEVTQNSCDNTSKEQWEAEDDTISSTIGSGVTSEINRKKLQKIENLVQKLKRLNSCHDEARTDYIASLCENTNPDHRYISEILLASGLLLRDLGSNLSTFQFHQSGHPINPELFLVLEQTKSSSLLKEDQKKPDKEKFHRKLVFDTVNELLVGKLTSVGHTQEPWIRPCKLAKKALNGQKLLRDLCSEIDKLQVKRTEWGTEEEEDGLKDILSEDVTQHSESWTDFQGEIPVMVLEVERLIFKDLVNEIVMDESSGLRRKQQPSRRCRQLFVK